MRLPAFLRPTSEPSRGDLRDYDAIQAASRYGGAPIDPTCRSTSHPYPGRSPIRDLLSPYRATYITRHDRLNCPELFIANNDRLGVMAQAIWASLSSAKQSRAKEALAHATSSTASDRTLDAWLDTTFGELAHESQDPVGLHDCIDAYEIVHAAKARAIESGAPESAIARLDRLELAINARGAVLYMDANLELVTGDVESRAFAEATRFFGQAYGGLDTMTSEDLVNAKRLLELPVSGSASVARQMALGYVEAAMALKPGGAVTFERVCDFYHTHPESRLATSIPEAERHSFAAFHRIDFDTEWARRVAYEARTGHSTMREHA